MSRSRSTFLRFAALATVLLTTGALAKQPAEPAPSAPVTNPGQFFPVVGPIDHAVLEPLQAAVIPYLERLAANPNAYPPAIKAQIDWRIGVTGKSLAKAYPAGVRIAYGTDAGVSKHGRNADEFELLVKFGMPPVEAIKAATVNAAELLGVDKETGTIEVGKAADIIAVDGDPLSDVKVLKAMKFVMARGNVVVAP